MCIYETKLYNVKYLPNKKNKGRAPTISDYRQNTISIGCGWCSECRKQIANGWRIRLYEEIKTNKHYKFVTLSFSPAAIKQLETDIYLKGWKGIETEDGILETDVNDIAGFAIRRFCERWRKKYKKSPRHWLITELGHKNSERIHIHGLIEGNEDDINKLWQYGNVYIGEYVNERTINYIVKYVTKLDEYHKGYKQKIFASKGLGKEYIYRKKEWHKYNGDKTITYYKTHNGYKLGLPRYYKEKIWSEEERENLWSQRLDEHKLFIHGNEVNTADESKENVDKFDKMLEGERELNKKAGYGDNKTGNKKYIITDIMKMNKDEIINYNKDKLVKCVEKREIDSIKKYEDEHQELITKSKNHDTIYYYKYKGTTTEAQRNYNELLEDAKKLKITVRKLRLIKEGIVTFNSQISAKQQIELGEKLITLLKNKYENNNQENKK